MNNMIKATALMLSVALISSFAGCSGSNTASESSESTVESVQSSIESSIENESSEAASIEPESSAEVVSDESSVNSNSSAIDPAVEERSYSDEEQTKFQDTKIPLYKYYPYNKSYYYQGNESVVTIPSDFSTCPHIMSDTVTEITVPETVTNIPRNAFTGCPNLKKLVILNPNCEFEVSSNSAVGISELKQVLPTLDIEVYVYCNSDKTPAYRYNEQIVPKSLVSQNAKFFGNYNRLLIHDLATESYE